MSDIIDMPAVSASPSYAGILKGAGALREEAGSCDRCGSILLTAGGLVAMVAWAWAGWSLVHLKQGTASDVPPFGVAIATVFGLSTFMFAWALCGNYRRRAIGLRLSADLALAQRDVAINSHETAAHPKIQHAVAAPAQFTRPATPAQLPRYRKREPSRAA